MLFVVASLVVIAVPGQDMVLVMSRSVAQGSAAGIATATGVSFGLLAHTVFAALGVGAVLRASQWSYLALKLIGAAYLVYLGLGLLRTRSTELVIANASTQSLGRLFLDGALSNMANPKIAIFYLAFLPQFVYPDATNPTLSVLVLGLAFSVLTFAVKGPVGLCAGLLSAWLRARPGALLWLYRSSGAVIVGLGLKLVFERQH